MQMESGKYRFTLKLLNYRDFEGDFIITDGQTISKDISMKPAFGSVTITSEPTGALIQLDGNPTNQRTPFTLEKIPSGIHTITMSRDMYSDATQRFDVKDEQTSKVFLELVAGYGTIGIVAKPDASINIDGNSISTGSYTGRLAPGIHLVEAKKDKFYSQRKEINVISGDEMKLNFELLPILGSLSVMCEPIETEIQLNGDNKGFSPKIISGLFIGDYSLKLSKAGYLDLEESIRITENKTAEIVRKLKPGYNLKVNSIPYGSEIYINGNYRNITPGTFFLGEGNLSVEVKSKYYKDKLSNFNLKGDTSLSFNLEPKMDMVRIASIPRNAQIYFDRKYSGNTPYNVELPQGNRSIIFKKYGYRTVESTILLDGSRDTFKQDLDRYRSTGISFISNLILPSSGLYYLWKDSEYFKEDRGNFLLYGLLGCMTHGLTIGGFIAGTTADEGRGAGWVYFSLGALTEVMIFIWNAGEIKKYKSWRNSREATFNFGE